MRKKTNCACERNERKEQYLQTDTPLLNLIDQHIARLYTWIM